MTTYKFWKMSGAGNDFVVINDLDKQHIDQYYVAKTAELVGCEGVIFLQPSEIADLKMRFLTRMALRLKCAEMAFVAFRFGVRFEGCN